MKPMETGTNTAEKRPVHTGIVVAAGKGSRFGANVPKQYLPLGEKPLLWYCLSCMEKSFLDDIILVVAPGDEDYCMESFLKPWGITKIRAVLPGGKERSDSVYNALKWLKESSPVPDYVYIHDGARPFLSVELLESLKEDVLVTGACVAASKAVDTIKTGDNEGFVTGNPDRASLYAVQTPQVFNFPGIMDAYEDFMAEKEPVKVTDDVEVYQRYTGRAVKLNLAGKHNMKITTADDQIIAEALIDKGGGGML